MNKVENDAILTADNHIMASNVIEFIELNRETDKQVCFQGDGQGRFYVGVGEFENYKDPQIKDTGALIYDASDQRSVIENCRCAEHLANLMNAILSRTKGNAYVSKDPFKIKGFFGARGDSGYFICRARGYAGVYYDSYVNSYDNSAVWW